MALHAWTGKEKLKSPRVKQIRCGEIGIKPIKCSTTASSLWNVWHTVLNLQTTDAHSEMKGDYSQRM